MPNKVQIVADSISPTGDRVTTMIVKLWRPLTAQFNTHRMFSRNSASSRAIPVKKMVNREPMFPMSWPAEKPGMQGGNELEYSDRLEAQAMWETAYRTIERMVSRYVEEHPDSSTRLHKSYLNRLLEPFQEQEILVTATEWDNFFDLRSSRLNTDTQYEFRVVADEMLTALEESVPVEVGYDGDHLPLCEDREELVKAGFDPAKVSVGRCARISYLTHLGERDPADDERLHDQLREAGHASPFEHVCTPMVPSGVQRGNLIGWTQYRHLIGL